MSQKNSTSLHHFKPLTKEAVRLAASQLMERFGSTTTLEVKNVLRASEYIAFQDDISGCMDELAEEEFWYFDCNGTFRTYRKTFPISENERMVLVIYPN